MIATSASGFVINVSAYVLCFGGHLQGSYKDAPYLKEVYQQTKHACECGYVVGDEHRRVTTSEQEAKMQEGTTVILSEPEQLPDKKRGRYKTKISVVNTDSLTAVKQLLGRGCKSPAILNMANAYHPGGSVEQGAKAQEESLFRCSNYYRSLDPACNTHLKEKIERLLPNMLAQRRVRGVPEVDENSEYLIPVDGVIYSPGVTVFRDGAHEYAYVDQPFQVDMIACAAFDRNPLHVKGDISSHVGQDSPQDTVVTVDGARVLVKAEGLYREGMRQKLLSILRTACNQSSDSIVLGAFGCGAFDDEKHTNRTTVIDLLQEIFQSGEFTGVFKEIVFAVLESNSLNYKTFRDAFDGTSFVFSKSSFLRN